MDINKWKSVAVTIKTHRNFSTKMRKMCYILYVCRYGCGL